MKSFITVLVLLSAAILAAGQMPKDMPMTHDMSADQVTINGALDPDKIPAPVVWVGVFNLIAPSATDDTNTSRAKQSFRESMIGTKDATEVAKLTGAMSLWRRKSDELITAYNAEATRLQAAAGSGVWTPPDTRGFMKKLNGVTYSSYSQVMASLKPDSIKAVNSYYASRKAHMTFQMPKTVYEAMYGRGGKVLDATYAGGAHLKLVDDAQQDMFEWGYTAGGLNFYGWSQGWTDASNRIEITQANEVYGTASYMNNYCQFNPIQCQTAQHWPTVQNVLHNSVTGQVGSQNGTFVGSRSCVMCYYQFSIWNVMDPADPTAQYDAPVSGDMTCTIAGQFFTGNMGVVSGSGDGQSGGGGGTTVYPQNTLKFANAQVRMKYDDGTWIEAADGNVKVLAGACSNSAPYLWTFTEVLETKPPADKYLWAWVLCGIFEKTDGTYFAECPQVLERYFLPSPVMVLGLDSPITPFTCTPRQPLNWSPPPPGGDFPHL